MVHSGILRGGETGGFLELTGQLVLTNSKLHIQKELGLKKINKV